MNTRDRVLLGFLLAIGAAVVVWQSGRKGNVPETALGAVDGVTWKAGYPEGHQHLALPWEIGTVLWGPHPLYCGGNHMGQYRDQLIARGWGWIADPPSEATI